MAKKSPQRPHTPTIVNPTNLDLLNLTAKHGVEVSISYHGDMMWVNVDEVCRLRIHVIGSGKIVMDDHRPSVSLPPKATVYEGSCNHCHRKDSVIEGVPHMPLFHLDPPISDGKFVRWHPCPCVCHRLPVSPTFLKPHD